MYIPSKFNKSFIKCTWSNTFSELFGDDKLPLGQVLGWHRTGDNILPEAVAT